LGNPKKIFFDIITHILQIIYVSSEKKQIATVVLQLWLFAYCCLVLPIICIALVLRLGTLQEERLYLYRHVECCCLRQRLVATVAEFQHSVVYYMTDQCGKNWKSLLINAEGGHFEHLL